ncbi:hypothetical protein BGZ54_010124 [Gamsiella multidivaricata]|nr:hypothetical protein BGZ54_010124 [Gamsiella multidivaricata]
MDTPSVVLFLEPYKVHLMIDAQSRYHCICGRSLKDKYALKRYFEGSKDKARPLCANAKELLDKELKATYEFSGSHFMANNTAMSDPSPQNEAR